ncbi:MAG TPA: helix-turn-helix domain-containing protein [Acidobacteriota bacterium]|jgi:excisionase family DNA binding protein|nr:helix-turn-helix domain-containing protein [Acidobacteriota bacterium]
MASRNNPASEVCDPRLMRTSEAARYLGLGAKALRQLINSGELPYLQLQGKNSPFLVDRRDLDKFIDRHKIGSQ